MKIRVLLSVLVVPLLSACIAAPPEIPLHEIPAGPLAQALEQRRRSFTGMKAVARVETEHKGRKRSYESVAILQRRFEKLRVEGHGPMGESVFALVWDGLDVMVRKAGESEPVKVGQFGLERIIGVSVSPADLCAVLSGNIPRVPDNAETSVRCSDAGWCVMEVHRDDMRLRVKVLMPAASVSGDTIRIDRIESFERDHLVFDSVYTYPHDDKSARFPTTITLANPERRAALTVYYEDVEANIVVEDSAFVLDGEGGAL